MKDIAKMREEMERKIKEAELENQFEEQLGIHVYVFSESGTQAGKMRLRFTDVTKEQARMLLTKFPWTERAKRTKSATDSGVIELSYILGTSQGPRDPYTKLEIEWIHNGYHIDVDMPIKPDDAELMAYFRKDWYTIDDSTIGLFFGAVSNNERDRLSRRPVLSFNCGSQIRYYGGRFLQTSEGHAECIVSEIIGE